MTYNRKLDSISKADRIKKIIAEKVEGKIIPRHDNTGHHYEFVETGTIVDSVTTINGWLAKHHLAFWAAGCAIDWLEKDNRFSLLNGPERENTILAAKNAHTDIRDDAGNVGTQAHDCIERYIKEWLKTGTRPKDIRLFFPTEKGETVFGYYIKDLDVTICKTDLRAIAAARAAEAVMIKEEIIPIATEILVGDENYSAGTLDFMCLHEGKLVIWDWKTSNNVDEYGYPLQVGAYKGFFEKMTRIKVEGLVLVKLSKDYADHSAYDVPDLKEAYESFKLLAKFYQRWLKKPREERLIKIKKRLHV